MRKKLSNCFALVLAIALSIIMTAAPVAQAASDEWQKTGTKDSEVKEASFEAAQEEQKIQEQVQQENLEPAQQEVTKQQEEIQEEIQEAAQQEITKQQEQESVQREVTKQQEEAQEAAQQEVTKQQEPVQQEGQEIKEQEGQKLEEQAQAQEGTLTESGQEEFNRQEDTVLDISEEMGEDMVQDVTQETKVVGGTCGTNLTWRLMDTGKLYIEGTGAMKDYEDAPGAEPEWIIYRDNIKEVSLSNGITSIGNMAFMFCQKLEKITIPSTVTKIGDSAFLDCSFPEIKIPSGVSEIGNGAFSNCNKLSKIEIPNVTSIGERAFLGCKNLKKVELSNRLTSIKKAAFMGCIGLTQIKIPDSVIKIESYAFYECSSLIVMKIFNNNCVIFDSVDTINPITILEGYKDSAAQAYAAKYNRRFVELFYSISYDVNGGKNAPVAQTKEKDIALTLSEQKPTRTGYTFLAWCESKTGEDTFYSPGASFEEEGHTTLYAIWEANTYKVAFNKNGGTGSMTTKTYTYGKSYALTANSFTRTGYIFNGWNTKADGTGKTYADKASVKNLSAVAGKTVTLYAQWKLKQYEITYELNGGTNNQENPASYTVATATITLKNPARKGYTFSGWYTSSDYTTKVTAIAKGSTGAKKFYARWTAIRYRIRYNKNGATSGTMADTTSCQYNKSYTLRKNTFQKTAYVFNGWNTKADGTGKTYANQASVKNLTAISGKTVTLYAQWKARKYSITYQLNGGTNNPSNPASYTITTATITLKNPTRRGYRFRGWYTSSKYTTKVTKIAKGSTGNKTLYAKWEANWYTIRYNGDGATSGTMADSKFQYDKTYSLRKNTFAKKGYTFLGWSYSTNGKAKYKDGEKIKNISGINNKVVTLYAVWQKN